MSSASATLSLNTMAWMAGIQNAMKALGPLQQVAVMVGTKIGEVFSRVVPYLEECVNEAASMEKQLVSMTTLLGGNEQAAHDLVGKMQELADVSPLQMPDITGAAKSMLAYGTKAKDVVGIIRTLGDVATGLDIPLGELADIYGKNLNQANIMAIDINQLQGRGIPIVEGLADALTARLGKQVNKADVMDMASKRQIKPEDMQAAFTKMTAEGGRFYNGMEASSHTWLGLMSTLGDAWAAIRRSIGEPIMNALKPLLSGMIGLVASAKQYAIEIGEFLGNVINFVVATFQTGSVTELLIAGLHLGAIKFINFLINGFATLIEVLVNGLVYSGTRFKAFFSAMVDPSFWKGMIHYLIGGMVDLGGYLMDAIAGSMRFLEKAFHSVLAYFSARMEYVFTHALSWMPDRLKKAMGLEGVNADRSFEQIYADKKKESDGSMTADWGMQKALTSLAKDAHTTAKGWYASGKDTTLPAHLQKSIDDAANYAKMQADTIKRGMNKPGFFNGDAEQARLDKVVQTIKDAMPEKKELKNTSTLKDRVEGPKEGGATAGVDWLQKIGGGGRVARNPMLDVAREQVDQQKISNAHLQALVNRGPSVSSFA